jgi:hypothetical protein
MAGGRPPTYDEKYCGEILDYFGVPPYEVVEKKVLVQGAVVEIPTERANDFPSFAGFARRIGVHRETLLNWTKKYPEFLDAYKRAKDMQEDFIATNGMRKLLDTSFAIFTAKNVLGWRDNKDQEVSPASVRPQMTDEQFNEYVKLKAAERRKK